VQFVQQRTHTRLRAIGRRDVDQVHSMRFDVVGQLSSRARIAPDSAAASPVRRTAVSKNPATADAEQ